MHFCLFVTDFITVASSVVDIISGKEFRKLFQLVGLKKDKGRISSGQKAQ